MTSPNGTEGRRRRGRPSAEQAPDAQAVLHTALEMFSRLGFDGVSMRTLAEECGVDPALLSRQYGSKHGLWEAVVSDISRQMQSWQQPMRQSQTELRPLTERLEIALRQFASFCVALPALSRFFIGEIRCAGPRADHVMQMLWQPHEGAMLPLLREAAEMGQLRIASAELASTMMIGIVCLPIVMASNRNSEPLEQILAEQLADALIGALTNLAHRN